MPLTDGNNHETIIKQTIGHFGRWQLKISILMALLKLPIAWFQLSIVFLAPPTQFWCKQPENYKNLSDLEWKSLAFYNNYTLLKNERLNSGYCEMFDKTTPCINGYNYNTTIFKSTIISEWDLVCGDQIYIDFVQITLMFGVLIGNVLFGGLADIKGRKTILMICILFQSIFGLLSAYVPNLWQFILMRFLLAIFNGGTVVVSFVMCMEIVDGKYRTIVPILYQIPFGFGNTLMAIIAYYVRDWRLFQACLSILSALYIIYHWLIPESPRWLLATGQTEKAIKLLEKATLFNRKPLEQLETTITDLSNIQTDRNMEKKTIFHIIPYEAIEKTMIVGVSFYAFSQYLGQISGNIFFTVACGGLIALPGTILCVFIVLNFGRRLTITFSHLFTAICYLIILFIPVGVFVHDWPRVLFAGFGIIGMSISMPALYLFTGELFPTVLRNAGVGLTVMFSRIGSMIAPLIIALHEVAPYLPLMILCCAACIEAILVLPLPETKGKPLPQTVYDLEMENATPMKELTNKYVPVATEDNLKE